jgi:hypothetical protein
MQKTGHLCAHRKTFFFSDLSFISFYNLCVHGWTIINFLLDQQFILDFPVSVWFIWWLILVCPGHRFILQAFINSLPFLLHHVIPFQTPKLAITCNCNAAVNWNLSMYTAQWRWYSHHRLWDENKNYSIFMKYKPWP